jgi:hypothetical protein
VVRSSLMRLPTLAFEVSTMTGLVVWSFAVEEGVEMDGRRIEKRWILCSNSERNDERNDGRRAFLVIKVDRQVQGRLVPITSAKFSQKFQKFRQLSLYY